MNTIESFYQEHPAISLWALLALGMVIILIIAAWNVGFSMTQWLAVITATVLLAGLCAWIIGWEDNDLKIKESEND
ncbi:MAG: hypothetical protein U9R25_17355 [Chloroflexota bacterium]|nr:hypothetical protein [Chloroflexota bacterium]